MVLNHLSLERGDMEGEVVTNPKGSAEVSIASTLIPWDRDDERALFFGYRASGLSVREALNMIKRSKPWLSAQRHDQQFVDLEKRIPEFRRALSKEYVEIEFFRNFRLVLEKDHQVLKKALRNEALTKNEQEYLIKLRSQYTPAQIQILEALVSGGGSGLDFSQFVADNPEIFQISRTDTITMARRKDGGS